MDKDMLSLLVANQATTLDMIGKTFASAAARQTIIADRKFDEVDVEQAVANRYSTTGQPNAATG